MITLPISAAGGGGGAAPGAYVGGFTWAGGGRAPASALIYGDGAMLGVCACAGALLSQLVCPPAIGRLFVSGHPCDHWPCSSVMHLSLIDFVTVVACIFGRVASSSLKKCRRASGINSVISALSLMRPPSLDSKHATMQGCANSSNNSFAGSKCGAARAAHISPADRPFQ